MGSQASVMENLKKLQREAFGCLDIDPEFSISLYNPSRPKEA